MNIAYNSRIEISVTKLDGDPDTGFNLTEHFFRNSVGESPPYSKRQNDICKLNICH